MMDKPSTITRIDVDDKNDNNWWKVILILIIVATIIWGIKIVKYYQ